MGSREASFTSALPGCRKFDNPTDRAELAAIWNIDEEELPRKRGLAYPDIIEAALAKKIKALWFIATNPVVSFPNFNLLHEALSTAEFIVMQDGFYPTPSMDYADLVLPASIWGVKEGTYTNSERRIGKVNVLVQPTDEVRGDFDIFLAVAKRLGACDRIFPGWATTHDAWLEWQKVSPGRMCDYSRFTWQQLEDEGGAQWGGESLYRDGVFPRENGRALLYCVPRLPFVEQPDRQYDLILNTGRTVEHWHMRTRPARSPCSTARCRTRGWR